jgi:phosphoribosylformylglycinamidine synthase
MKNDFRGKNRRGEDLKISVLPTLLVTSLGKYDVRKIATSDFKNIGDKVYLIGKRELGLRGSEFAEIYNSSDKVTPKIDLEFNKKIYHTLHKAIKSDLIQSCHDVSDGGLITTLLESSFGNMIGAQLNLRKMQAELLQILFSECPGLIVVSVSKESESSFLNLFEGLNILGIGETIAKDELIIESWEEKLRLDISELKQTWKGVF